MRGMPQECHFARGLGPLKLQSWRGSARRVRHLRSLNAEALNAETLRRLQDEDAGVRNAQKRSRDQAMTRLCGVDSSVD